MRRTALAAGVSPHNPAVHGHRGSPRSYPENGVAGFIHAIAVGADFIELDIAVSRDRALVVSHDPYLSPDGALIHALDLEEIRRRGVATLDEVLALAGRGHFGFNIEIKSFPDRPGYSPPPAEFAALLAAEIQEHGLEDRCLVQSFDFRTLHAMARIFPEIPLSALWDGHPRDFADIAAEAGTASVSVAKSLVTPARVQAAGQAGVRTLAWTVNGASAWSRTIAARVDGIITDDPAGLVAFLEHRGLRAQG